MNAIPNRHLFNRRRYNLNFMKNFLPAWITVSKEKTKWAPRRKFFDPFLNVSLAGCIALGCASSATTLKAVPSIDTPPASQMIECGTGVTFTVSATGTGPLSYHWRLNNMDIPGAVDSTYQIPIVSSGGSY